MAAEQIVTLTQENWEKCITQGLVLVDFWAVWCGPCRMVAPVLDELAVEYEGKLTIGKVNVDEQGDLSQKFGIMGIPTLLLFKDGEKVEQVVGFRGKEDLAALVGKYMAATEEQQ